MRHQPDLTKNRTTRLHHPAVFRVVSLGEGGGLKIAVGAAQQVVDILEPENIGQCSPVRSDVSMIRILRIEQRGRQTVEQKHEIPRVGGLFEKRPGLVGITL